MKMSETLGVLLICGLLSLVANVVGTKFGFFEAIPGMLFLIALAFIGIWLGKVMPGGIPGVAYVVTIGWACPLRLLLRQRFPRLASCSCAPRSWLMPASPSAKIWMYSRKAAGVSLW